MVSYYLMSAAGRDRPGIVSAVTSVLYKCGGNLEDSSMMRLGSEFGIFLIFTLRRPLTDEIQSKIFSPLTQTWKLTLSIRKLTRQEAKFSSLRAPGFLISVHGPDRPGIVWKVTDNLARHRFNITDLSTHRTAAGRSAGYVLLIEGVLASIKKTEPLRRSLSRLTKRLRTTISMHPISPNVL